MILVIIKMHPNGTNSSSCLNQMQMLRCTQKKFSVKDFFSKCDQIRKKLWIWLHLLKKFLTESFIYENLWQLL